MKYFSNTFYSDYKEKLPYFPIYDIGCSFNDQDLLGYFPGKRKTTVIGDVGGWAKRREEEAKRLRKESQQFQNTKPFVVVDKTIYNHFVETELTNKPHFSTVNTKNKNLQDHDSFLYQKTTIRNLKQIS